MKIENLRDFYEACKLAFIINAWVLVCAGFFFKNDVFPSLAKLVLFSFDLPLLIFAIAGIFAFFRLKDNNKHYLIESVVMFVLIVLFSLVVFFQWAYPDLI